ncbi:MAG: lysophospholipid acyltransferase family protein [Cyanobacteria bacterium P01_C01_bin.70]
MTEPPRENIAPAPDEETVALTPAVLDRVREGLAAARHSQARQHTAVALGNIAAIAQGQADPRVSGRFRRWLLRRFIRLFFRIRIASPENIPHGPVVLVANHLSHLDPFLILAVVPARPYYYILGDARTLYNKRWKRWVVGNAGGVIPLQRWWKEEIAVMQQAESGDRPDLQTLAAAIKTDVPNGSSISQMRQIDQAVQAILQRGDGIMLFPEGRLGSQEGQLHLPLKRGTVIYAMRSGVPIVPVAIAGTRTLFFRKQLTLRFGQPLSLPQQDRPKRIAIDQALSQVEAALSELLNPDYREPTGVKLLQTWLNQLFW